MPILNWLTRDEDVRTAQRVPYRLLEEVPNLSAGDGGAGNMLIQGDGRHCLRGMPRRQCRRDLKIHLVWGPSSED